MHASSDIGRVVRIAAVDDSAADRWNAFVARAPAASIYHRYEWRKLISATFGHASDYFAAYDAAERICGVLPLVRLRSKLFGDFMVSMPFFNYGGVLADDDAAGELLAHAATHARSSGVSHLELRHTAQLADWPVRTDKVTMQRRLPDSPEELSKQLGSKLRSQIKRPVREGAAGISGGAELLDEFYAVFARNMRDLGTPVYPRRFFAAALERFPQNARIFIVRLQGQAVAAGFTLGSGERLEIPWASSLREANAVGVNMLLYWQVLEYACRNGYKVFDFGRSTRDSGTFRFKQQWGAEPCQLYWHYWLRQGGEPPVMNPANPKYRLAVALWQRLPLAVANRLGPLLVKNLP
ncbi:MAG TPA: FemAB family XrtA/PEP-CTERM system-associated protein [Steroidobacteraceae bacterium]|nr:FemAB family XrtA/PEP-CTERM system-associated protein [Steroidobacteraceae bacterium]